MARKVRSWMLVHPALASLSFLGMLVVVVLGFLGAAQATDQAVFCNSCHEMSPYYSAWREGPHADVPCVDCHVDSDKVKQLTHKFVALEEVWVHVLGDPTFPMTENAPIPDKRCLSCHQDITEPGYAGFSHRDHAAKGPCTDCHDNAGHTVTEADLEAAGILNFDGLKANSERRIAAVGQGAANLEGHAKTGCESCHDMRATGCASCHTPEHEKRPQSCTTCHTTDATWAFAHPKSDTCVDCHALPKDHVKTAADVRCAVCHSQRGIKWTFSHPAAGSSCATCHNAPAKHRSGACQTCHKKAGASWAFSHPTGASCTTCHARPAGHSAQTCTNCHSTGRTWAFKHPASGNCAGCHARPAGHSAQTCTTCHKQVGASWAFAHPGSGATCTGCHARPAGHSAQTCVNCHSIGTTWTFRHPGASATCTNCHNRPSGHSAGTCTSCHSVGATWSFSHPSSTACASCHTAPSNHYGSSCSSCHTPSRAWGSATFTHPRVPGGEHTYRSFSCASCHTSGYSSYSCTGCHGPDGPDDD